MDQELAQKNSMGTVKPRKRRMFLSLRFLASMAAASLVGITVLVVMWVNEQNMRKALIQGAQTQLVLEARNLAITSSDALLSDFPELTLIPLVKSILQERPEILDVVIIDHQGKIQGSREARDVGTAWQKPQGMAPVEMEMLPERSPMASEALMTRFMTIWLICEASPSMRGMLRAKS